jgi:predicted aspartyl protease
MGRTTVEAFAIGPNGTRRFEFLVDTGSTFAGLPIEDIEALGLPMVHGGRRKVMTATGVIEQETYSGAIRLNGEVTPALVSEAPVPLIGVEVLQLLGMKVNPVTHKLEKPGEDEIPYMALRL